MRFKGSARPKNDVNFLPQSEGIVVHYVTSLCESRWKSVWLGILFGYKFIMQGVGVFLAFKIRKVKVLCTTSVVVVVVDLCFVDNVIVNVCTHESTKLVQTRSGCGLAIIARLSNAYVCMYFKKRDGDFMSFVYMLPTSAT